MRSRDEILQEKKEQWCVRRRSSGGISSTLGTAADSHNERHK